MLECDTKGINLMLLNFEVDSRLCWRNQSRLRDAEGIMSRSSESRQLF